MPQTSVAATLPVGVEGMLADSWTEANGIVDSAPNVDTASIPFGRFVQRNAAGGVLMLTAITNVLGGVSVHSNMYSKPDQLDSVGIVAGNDVGLLRLGRIYVLAETSFAEGTAVHVRALVNGGATVIGGVRSSADGVTTIDISGIAQFKNSGSAGDLAIVEVTLVGV
jgi:hypothetical protein